jgi:hypothetical protein
MGRKAKLTEAQVGEIRAIISLTQKELAKEYNVSLLTIWKVKNYKEAYRLAPEDIGTPVLNSHGEVVDILATEPSN